jgi:CDGSH-type Zn-finger protein
MSTPVVTIRCRENGPLVIALDPAFTVQVIDHQGQPFTIQPGKPSVALCRCGVSKNKPFCDGSHKSCGFLAAELAVAAAPATPTPAQPPDSPRTVP